MRTTRTIRLSGCRKIPKSLISVKIRESDDGTRSFDAKLDLARLNLPPTAAIYIDTNVLNSYQRFAFGTVSEIKQPDSTELSDLDLDGTVQFRLKVVDNSDRKGRLLASAHGIKAKDEGDAAEREPLLRLLKYDLGDVPWRVEFMEDAMPGLILNRRIPGVIQLTEHDAVFQALLLPAAIRQVYSKIFSDPDWDADAATWQGKWLRFGMLLTGRDAPALDENEQIGLWIEGVVEKFSSQHGLTEKVIHKMEGEA